MQTFNQFLRERKSSEGRIGDFARYWLTHTEGGKPRGHFPRWEMERHLEYLRSSEKSFDWVDEAAHRAWEQFEESQPTRGRTRRCTPT